MTSSLPIPVLMSDDPELDAAAMRLLEASRTMTPCAPVRDLVGSDDVWGAYEVQQRVVAAQVASGSVVVGRKIGLTSAAVRVQLGVDQPDFGVLFDNMEVPSGGMALMSRLLQPKIEAELAFVLGASLEAGPLDRRQITAAVEYVAAALEIVDSRVISWDISLADTIADNACSGLFVLGDRRRGLGEVEPSLVEMTLMRGRQVVSTGDGAACLGDPLDALAWLARTSIELGAPLQAGQIVLSGALGPMVSVTGGETYTARITGLGPVSVQFVDDRAGRRSLR